MTMKQYQCGLIAITLWAMQWGEYGATRWINFTRAEIQSVHQSWRDAVLRTLAIEEYRDEMQRTNLQLGLQEATRRTGSRYDQLSMRANDPEHCAIVMRLRSLVAREQWASGAALLSNRVTNYTSEQDRQRKIVGCIPPSFSLTVEEDPSDAGRLFGAQVAETDRWLDTANGSRGLAGSIAGSAWTRDREAIDVEREVLRAESGRKRSRQRETRRVSVTERKRAPREYTVDDLMHAALEREREIEQRIAMRTT